MTQNEDGRRDKAASAMIARIPYPLAAHIAATFKDDAQQDRGDLP